LSYREQELAELQLDMRSGQNVVLVSPRRFGKTSLVLIVAERLRAQGVLVAYLDLLTTPSKATFANGLATALYRDLVGFKGRAWHKLQQFFGQKSLLPTLKVGPDGTPSIELGLGERSGELDTALARLLEIPGQVATDQKKRVAVVLDEFQEARLIDDHLPTLIRSVWQMQPDVSHVFLGSQRHMMQRLFTDKSEPMYRMAKPMTLDAIPSDVFATFIKGRFAATGREITGAAVDRLLEITSCHPHDTQELAYFTWNLAFLEGVVATQETVEHALDRVLRAESARYTEVWSRLTKTQRLVLLALATSGGAKAIYSESYRQQYGLGAQSTVQSSLKGLRDTELVDMIPPAKYWIPDPFLRAWLLRMTGAVTG